VRLEVGRLEQQLLLSYDATEIRGLVEKLVAAKPAKPQWRINNKVHYYYYYYYYYFLSRFSFFPGTSPLEPVVNSTTQASSLSL
jgi:hypothetical protein